MIPIDEKGPNGEDLFFQTSTGKIVNSSGRETAPATKEDEPEVVPPDKTFDPTGNNVDFFDDSMTNVNALIDSLQNDIFNKLIYEGVRNGWGAEAMGSIFGGHWTTDGVRPVIDKLLQSAEAEKERWFDLAPRLGEDPMAIKDSKMKLGGMYFVQTLEGYNEMAAAIWDFYNTKTPFDLGDWASAGEGSGGGGGGGGGGGPTAEDIRGKFDLDELTEAGKNIWRGMLLTDDADIRGMAKSYVDAIVASKGKKKIDFVEFIRGKAKETDRYASIYSSKPDSLSEEQYLAPYFQAAMQVAAPGDADELAIGGAQFGADAQTFAARLRRSEAATSSAPFIEELQSRLTALNKLFKG